MLATASATIRAGSPNLYVARSRVLSRSVHVNDGGAFV